MNNLKDSLYMYLLGHKATKTFLAATTFIIGYQIGSKIVVENFDAEGFPAVAAGIIAGLLLSFFLDGTLGGLFNQILHDQKPHVWLWVAAGIFSLGTGFATWLSSGVIGAAMVTYIDPLEKQEMIDQAREAYDNKTKKLKNDISQIEKDVRAIERQIIKDSASVVAGFPERFQKMFLSPEREYYYGRRNYRTYTRYVDQYKSKLAPYQSRIKEKTAALATLETARTGFLTQDEGARMEKDIDEHNNRQSNKENTIIKAVRFVDIAAAIFMWITFLLIRHMKLDKDVAPDQKNTSFVRWAMDTATAFQRKALLTDTKVDDAFALMIMSMLKVLASILGLIARIGEIAANVILLLYFKKKKPANAPANGQSNGSANTPSNASSNTPANTSANGHSNGMSNGSPGGSNSVTNSVSAGNNVSANASANTANAPRKMIGFQRPANTPSNRSANAPANGQGVEVVVVDEEPFVIHNGKQLKRRQVSNFISAYNAKIDKSKSRLQKAINEADQRKISDVQEVISNQTRTLNYWKACLNTLDRMGKQNELVTA